MKKTVIVTGCAGFIGFHLCKKLLATGFEIIGIDNLNDYYDPKLKHDRLALLNASRGFSFNKIDIADKATLDRVFTQHKPPVVIHLAAQAGVRYSIENPDVYINANLVGFSNILESCRHHEIEHLIYASSSSVYGANAVFPFSESHGANHPMSLYGATKKANEVMAHAYANVFSLPCTGLRFFTVYGPWGRPDMAIFKFIKNMLAGNPIDVYNNGNLARDFTYIDDVVKGIFLLLQQPAKPNKQWSAKQPDPASSYAPFRTYNIGIGSPVQLMDFITELESALGIKATKNFMPMQPGDVKETFADTTALREKTGYSPSISITEGVRAFVDWYCEYYRVAVPVI